MKTSLFLIKIMIQVKLSYFKPVTLFSHYQVKISRNISSSNTSVTTVNYTHHHHS